ncbi:MAG: AI-2E family transporter [Nitrospirota bacterium]
MATNRFYSLMLISLLVLLAYLTYKIISPFLTAIAWAVVFSIIFYPVYVFISRYIKIKSLASAITVTLILLIIIGPFTYLSVMVIDELKVLISNINEGRVSSIRDIIESPRVTLFLEKAYSYIGIENLPTEQVLIENIKKIGTGLMNNLSIRITNIISVAIDFIFMILITFFLLRDGPDFLLRIKDYMPFSDEHKNRLGSQVKDMIVSTVYGGVTVAVIQGILGGFAFYFVGMDSPVLWGFAMSVMSFVPFLGTFSIWGSVAVYLIIKGSYIQGFGLFLFGSLVISMVDNILKPLIIGSRTKMHTILIFISVFGGIKLFGLIGLIMGPLIMAIFLSVFEIFRSIEGGANA